MRKELLVAAVIASGAINAQTVTPTVLSNNGGYSQTASGSIAWTVGEPVSDTYSKPANITTMGFHQTDMEIVAMIKEQDIAGGLAVFPNPVRDILNISFKGMAAGAYTVRLTDGIGKLIMEKATVVDGETSQLEMRMSEVAAGNYYVTVSGKDINQSIQVTKVY